MIVTPAKEVQRLQHLCKSLEIENVQVLGAPYANKRLQMVQGIKTVTTPITVFADDDVVWPLKFLTHILAAFEDDAVGAAGGYTSASRDRELNIWEFLGVCYLERWNFEVAATVHIDGGIPCLSGRTQIIRTQVVQNQDFIDYFVGEKWFGVSLLAADDDNSLTRWLVSHDWKIKIQCTEEATLITEMENNSAFLGQCVRWSRTTWRSNITSMWTGRSLWW